MVHSANAHNSCDMARPNPGIRNNLGLPHGCQRPEYYYKPSPPVSQGLYFGYLELGVEPKLNPRNFNMGCRHPKRHFYHLAKCLPLSFIFRGMTGRMNVEIMNFSKQNKPSKHIWYMYQKINCISLLFGRLCSLE